MGEMAPLAWTQWLDLRNYWGAFQSVGRHHSANLSTDSWLLDWRDSAGYHWRITDDLTDGEQQAVSWIDYLARR
jgi:hypothetical protein